VLASVVPIWRGGPTRGITWKGRLSRAPATNVNHPRGAAWQDGELRASSIYDRYQEDFGGTEAGVLGHLLRNARRELAERLRGYGGRSTMTTTGR
jgi:hypothetical protein